MHGHLSNTIPRACHQICHTMTHLGKKRRHIMVIAFHFPATSALPLFAIEPFCRVGKVYTPGTKNP